MEDEFGAIMPREHDDEDDDEGAGEEAPGPHGEWAHERGAEGHREAFARAVVKVIGVGGGGGNAVNRMVLSGLEGAEFYAANTDAQSLSHSAVPPERRIHLGKNLTRGLGAGGDPAVGEQSIDEAVDAIDAALAGADMVFVTAGMGGGTGSGAAPYVARRARSMGILTVGIVTAPFFFEGRRRAARAEAAIDEMYASVDTCIVIPNDRLLETVPEGEPIERAFLYADDLLKQGVQGIVDIVSRPGLVNVDFADVRSVMASQRGTYGMFGTGIGQGSHRAKTAAEQAVNCPLLEFPIDRASGIVFNITGGHDMSLSEVNEASALIGQLADPDANIIFGAVVDEALHDEVRVTVVATMRLDNRDGGDGGPATGRMAVPSFPGSQLPESVPFPKLPSEEVLDSDVGKTRRRRSFGGWFN